MKFNTTYADAKAGFSHFSEALHRETDGEKARSHDVPWSTVTPMMRSSRAGPEQGFFREPARLEAVADAIVKGREQMHYR